MNIFEATMFCIGVSVSVAIVSYALSALITIIRNSMRKKCKRVDPTPAQIASACLSFDHGFGLLSKEERAQMMRDAVEWKRAWDKETEYARSCDKRIS